MLEQSNKIKELSKPLIDYIRENYNSYTRIEISSDCIRILEDKGYIPINIANNDIGE